MSILPPSDLLTLRDNITAMDALKSATGNPSQKLSSGQEPVSGEQGKGSVGEPFDQGNAEGERRFFLSLFFFFPFLVFLWLKGWLEEKNGGGRGLSAIELNCVD